MFRANLDVANGWLYLGVTTNPATGPAIPNTKLNVIKVISLSIYSSPFLYCPLYHLRILFSHLVLTFYPHAEHRKGVASCADYTWFDAKTVAFIGDFQTSDAVPKLRVAPGASLALGSSSRRESG